MTSNSPIKHLFSVSKNMVAPELYGDSEVFHYSLPAWHEFGGGLLESAADLASGKLLLDGGEILVSKLNPEKNAVLVAESHDVPTLCSPEFIALVPERIHGKFGYYLMLSAPIRYRLNASVESVTNSHKRARVDQFLASTVSVPDFATQCQIADFLDRETARIDLLIENKHRLVKLLEEKYEATTRQLSTGKLTQDRKVESGIDWLGAIPQSWRIEKLVWHFAACKGRDAQKYTKEYCAANEGAFPVYSGQTANEGVMGLINTYDYDFGMRGVLLATTVGAKAMDLRHLQGKFSLSQNCMIIVPRRAIPIKFFLYQMRVLFQKERQLIPDHMQASFRVEDLYRYRIAVPPLDQATEIGHKIENAEATLRTLTLPVSTSIDRLKEYRSALITAAVTGQVDVTTCSKSGTGDRRLDAIQEEMRA